MELQDMEENEEGRGGTCETFAIGNEISINNE